MSEIDRALEALGNAALVGTKIPELEVMPTESKALNDDILACGGLPRGRAVEIYAQSSVGKSTFCQWLAGQVQRQEWSLQFRNGDSITRFGTVCWFDAERSLMKGYAEGSGMDLSQVVVPDFGLGNDMLYKLKQVIALDAFDLIVVDSMQAVIPDSVADIQGSRSMKDKLAASVMWAQFFQELQGGYKIRDAAGKLISSKSPEFVYRTGKDDDDEGSSKRAPKEGQVDNFHRLGSKKCCLIFINHARTKIQTGFASRGGSKTYTPGGGEKDYAFAARIELKHRGNKMGKTKGEKVLRFKEVEFKSIKNKLGMPLRSHVFGLGIDGRLILDDDDLHDIELDLEADQDDDEEDAITSLKKKMQKLKDEEAEESDGGDSGSADEE